MSHNGKSHTLLEGIAHTLSGHAGLLIFAYSPKSRTNEFLSGDSVSILGARESSIAIDCNILLRYVHADDKFRLLEAVERTIAGHGDLNETYRWIRPDNGSTAWVQARCALKGTPGDDGSLLCGIVADISSYFLSYEWNPKGADSAATVLGALDSLAITTDFEEKVVRTNHSGTSVLSGLFELPKLTPGTLIAESIRLNPLRAEVEVGLKAVLQGERPNWSTLFHHEKSYVEIKISPLMSSGQIVGALILASDATSQVMLRQERDRLSKREASRLLTSSVAHNLNNSIQALLGHAAAIRAHPENKPLIVHSSDAIIEMSSRAAEITRELLTFTEQDEHSTIDLNLLVMRSVKNLESNLFSGTLSVVFGPSISVKGSESKLLPIIGEVLNSIHKHSSVKGLSLVTSTFSSTLGSNGTEKFGRLKILSPNHEFESVFSNPNSEYLVKIRKMLSEVGGEFRVEKEVGSGHAFWILFPTPKDSREELNIQSHEHSEISPKVLIVDDDLLVLETVSRILTEGGISVAIARDANEALSTARKHALTLRLALIDAVMPGMPGAVVCGRLKALLPSILVVGFSGAAREETDNLVAAGASEIIRKPIDPRRVRARVMELLTLEPMPQNSVVNG